jgi:hypothetical protein
MKVRDLQAILAKCQPDDNVTIQAGPAFPGGRPGGWYGAEWVTRLNGITGPLIVIYATGTRRKEMDEGEVEVQP